MFIDITRLQNRSTNEFLYKNTIVLDEALYKNTDIRKLSPVEVSADIKRITDTSYKMSLEIKGEMTLPCSITLNDVIYPFDIKTEVKLSNEDEEDEEYVKIIQNNISTKIFIYFIQNLIICVIIYPQTKGYFCTFLSKIFCHIKNIF